MRELQATRSGYTSQRARGFDMSVITRAGAAAALIGGALFVGSRTTEVRAGVRLPTPTLDTTLAGAASDETIVFAGGCFWGVQAVFEHVRGVKSAVSGYAGGTAVSPSYEDVSSGTTGHAE